MMFAPGSFLSAATQSMGPEGQAQRQNLAAQQQDMEYKKQQMQFQAFQQEQARMTAADQLRAMQIPQQTPSRDQASVPMQQSGPQGPMAPPQGPTMFSQGQGQGMAPPMQPQMFSQGGQPMGGSPQPPPLPAYRTVAQGQPQAQPQAQGQPQGQGQPGAGGPPNTPQAQPETREQLQRRLMAYQPPLQPNVIMGELDKYDKIRGVQLTQQNQQLQADTYARNLATPKPLQAPPTRNVIQGGNEMQQEMQPDGSWKTIGQGPRFAKQLAAPGGVGGSAAGGAPSTGAKGLTGDAYLKTLPAGMAATVKAIAEGRETFSEAGRGSKDRKALMEAVNLYNPDYSSVGVKANAGALMQNSKDLAAIRPYKEMLDTNIDIAIDLGRKVIKSDSAMANRSLNWIKQNAGDHPDTAEYLAQINFVQTEAARVLSNPRLVGQLSDSARHEMQDVVSGNMPLNSSERVLNRIKKDGSNRVDALVREHDRLSGKRDKPEAASGGQDAEAITWAKSNPNDPRSAKILSLHGM